jgi:hypothetical protein
MTSQSNDTFKVRDAMEIRWWKDLEELRMPDEEKELCIIVLRMVDMLD